jgi:hypothetical protein
LPFVVAAIDVLVVSRGDPEVLSYLLQNLGLLPLILSIVVPLIPLAILLALLAWFTERRLIPKGEREKLHYGLPWLMAIVASTVVSTITISYLFFVLTIAVNIEIRKYFTHQKSIKERLRYGADFPIPTTFHPGMSFFAFILLFYVFQTFSSLSANWLPNETVKTKGESAVSGQIFSSNTDWTIFRDVKNKMHIVRTADVESRQACYPDTSILTKAVAVAIIEHFRPTTKVQCIR